MYQSRDVVFQGTISLGTRGLRTLVRIHIVSGRPVTPPKIFVLALFYCHPVQVPYPGFWIHIHFMMIWIRITIQGLKYPIWGCGSGSRVCNKKSHIITALDSILYSDQNQREKRTSTGTVTGTGTGTGTTLAQLPVYFVLIISESVQYRVHSVSLRPRSVI